MPNNHFKIKHLTFNIKTSLSPELLFLIACCQSEPDLKEIGKQLQPITNHQSLITAASRHGVLPLVYKTLKHLSEDGRMGEWENGEEREQDDSTTPNSQHLSTDSSRNTQHVARSTESQSDSPHSSTHSLSDHATRNIASQSDSSRSSQSPITNHQSLEYLLTDLKSAYLQIARKNMLMTSELIRIMQLLRENSIEALAFKGPALAQMAYGDITLRQYSDLHILVDEKDAYRAGKLMSENGHTAVLPLKILSNATCLHTAKDFSLMSKGGVHTELHWRLFEKKYAISIMSCAAEKKCQSVTINGKTLKTLQNELLLVYLCLHGAKHAFERIEWICDIDRLVRSTELYWDEAIAIAEQSHSKRSFYLGLSLAQSLFHTSLPQSVQSDLASETILQLQRMTLEQMSEKKEGRSDFEKHRKTFFYQSQLFDKKSDMLRFYLSTFFKISTTDCQTFTLPENLKFLYVVLRPVRLAWSYGQKLFVSRN